MGIPHPNFSQVRVRRRLLPHVRSTDVRPQNAGEPGRTLTPLWLLGGDQLSEGGRGWRNAGQAAEPELKAGRLGLGKENLPGSTPERRELSEVSQLSYAAGHGGAQNHAALPLWGRALLDRYLQLLNPIRDRPGGQELWV